MKEPAIELYFSLEKIEKNKDTKYVGSCITHCFSDQVIHKNMKVSQIQVLDSMKRNKTKPEEKSSHADIPVGINLIQTCHLRESNKDQSSALWF